jgi:hypothetical protein
VTCRTLCAAVVLSLLASASPVVAYGQGIQIATAPQVLREAIRQGEINTCQIEVTNTGAVPVKVVAEVVDLAIDEYGYNMSDAGSHCVTGKSSRTMEYGATYVSRVRSSQ